MPPYRSPLIWAAAVAAALASCSSDDPASPSGPEPNVEPPALATAANSWRVRADMPSPRVLLGAAVVPDAAGHSILYAIGGRSIHNGVLGGSQSKVHAYDATADTWRVRARLPQALLEPNGVVEIGGKIYLSGGIPADAGAAGHNRHLYVYDPATNVWSKKRDMPVPSFGGVSGAIDGKLYVLTSCRDFDPCGGEPIDKVFYRYDPATDQWTSKRRMPHPIRFGAGARVVVDGVARVEIVGGEGSNNLQYTP